MFPSDCYGNRGRLQPSVCCAAKLDFIHLWRLRASERTPMVDQFSNVKDPSHWQKKSQRGLNGVAFRGVIFGNPGYPCRSVRTVGSWISLDSGVRLASCARHIGYQCEILFQCALTYLVGEPGVTNPDLRRSFQRCSNSRVASVLSVRNYCLGS